MNERMSRIMDELKPSKEFLVWVAGVAIGTVGLMGWFSTNFVTIAKGVEISEVAHEADMVLSQQLVELAEEVKASNAMLMDHIEKEKLNVVLIEIKRNESEVFQITQFVSANGTNEQAEARLRQLRIDHTDLLLKRDCILNNNRLCN